MKNNLPSIPCLYGYVGANCCDVLLTAHFDKETGTYDSYEGIDLVNDYGEVMKTVHSLSEAEKFIEELASGKYAWRTTPCKEQDNATCAKCHLNTGCPGYYDGCYEAVNG